MAKVSPQITDTNSALAQQLNPVVYLPKITCPYTTVVKRAQCTDFSNDLMPRFGIERVMTQATQEVQGESGPNGERVLKPINDQHDAVRLVGAWTDLNNSYGTRSVAAISGGTSPYVEITFYGTGLNLLTVALVSMTGASYSLDGGASTSFWSGTVSDVLGARGYSSNTVIPVVSTTLGLHTVKIFGTAGSAFYFSGYEVLNTNSTLQQTAGTSYLGGKRLYAPSLTTSSPTSGFTNTYGTPGTRGGHVLVYQKADGSIAKDIRYTETAQANLTSADHTNESVIRQYNFVEFGAGRNATSGTADDWSWNTGNLARAFTLDDGTTTLVGSSCFIATPGSGIRCFTPTAANDFFTITFVGTGLDIQGSADAISGTLSTYTVSVDGGTANTMTLVQTTPLQTYKVVSGLPYGTHTVKFLCSVLGTTRMYWANFITYGPSKPALPSGCVELADYYVMADYIANSTAGDNTIGKGVLRKQNIREFTYVNGSTGTTDWTIPAVQINNCISGFTAYTDRLDAYVEYVFFGTGFEFRFLAASNRSANIQMSLQSLSTGGSLQNLTTANFPSISGNTSAYGTGVVFTPSTGILDMLDAASTEGGVSISALPLGTYKVRIQNKTASAFFICDALDIITPIHAPKGNLPGDIQNTATVGSCAISDNRKFSATSVKTLANWAQAVGVASGSPTTTSTTFVPMVDASLTLKTTGNPVQISYACSLYNANITAVVNTQLYVDGIAVGTIKAFNQPVAGYIMELSDLVIVPLSAGTHKIDLYWSVSSGTGTLSGQSRTLTVQEL